MSKPLTEVNKKVSYLNKKSLRVFEFWDSYVLYMFYRYEHYMSISHRAILLCFDLLTRPKMPFKVMHRKEVTHSGGSYERKSRGRKLADEMGRGKKDPIILT